jgi:predicted transposase YbfD/YdcC
MPRTPSKFIECIVEHFDGLDDPRVARTRRHPLINILVIGLAGVAAGASGWEGLEQFAASRKDWLRTFLDLPHGTPSADTIRRVFASLNPRAFEECFRNVIAEFARSVAGEVVAIDGKSLRGAIKQAGSKTPLHMVHVWATEQRLLLSQRAVGGAFDEVSATLEMLKLLELKNAIVTTDANGCTAEMTTAIRARGANYVLALKGNRGPQHKYVVGLFAEAAKSGYAGLSMHETTNTGHGRTERRTVRVLEPREWPDPKRLPWTDRRSAVMIERRRLVRGKETLETHYYLSSLPPDAAAHAHAIRAHWGIENHLHWALDVTFGEDRQRIRDKTAAENFAIINRLALMLLRNEKTDKHGAPTKRQRCAWEVDYLARVLTAGIPTL